MHKILPVIGATAFIALVLGCADGRRAPANPAGPSLSTGSSAGDPAVTALVDQARMVPREVHGVLKGRFDFTRTWGAEWWQFYADSVGTGTLSHLGLAQIRTTHVPNFQTLALEQAEFTLVAADGDEIHGTFEGQVAYDAERADLVHGETTFTVTGGTGRFAEATGTITATFLEVLDDLTWASAGVTWTLAGTVSY